MRHGCFTMLTNLALYAMGGKIRDIHSDKTAFYYRHAYYIIGIETIWETPAAESASLAWIASRFSILKTLTHGSYINFPYLETPNYMNAYYGKNAGRLTEIKQHYDPDNIFRFPQSIKHPAEMLQNPTS
ncbi:MAG: BBE domain-containing protein [Lachnospiraceae bacterium]